MLRMAKHKSSIYKAKLRRPSGGVYVVRQALAVPAKTKEIGLFATPSILQIGIARSASDMQGIKDHSKIPRIAGTTLVGYAESTYDEGSFVTGTAEQKLLSENIEGKRTRIMYIGPIDLSPLGTLRNYQKAFNDLGKVEEVYSCKRNDCF
jgi:hypothetical protein